MDEHNTEYPYNPYQQPKLDQQNYPGSVYSGTNNDAQQTYTTTENSTQNVNQAYANTGNGTRQAFYTAGSYTSGINANKEKKHGFGLTLVKCAALALVFGLVAGSVFTGVNYVGKQILHTDERGISDGKKNSNASNSSAPAQIQQTATGNATEVVDVSGIVEAVMPSIVAITNTGTITYQSFWGQQSYESESCGSGIIIDQDEEYLYIATNNHVVADADTLTVQFVDEKTVSCEIKGTDPADDLAVVKVSLKSIEDDTLSQIKIATVGDSNALKVGEAAIAIGNALGYGQSVTSGVISALGRTVTVTDQYNGTTVTNNNLIQTDAAINPGNSGGALLNTRGEVIGINSVKYSDTDVEGFGFAIPMSDAMDIIDQLIEYEKVAEKQSAYLGIQGQDVSSDVSQAYGFPEGVYVYRVISGSAAENAGIRQGDIITKLDGNRISSMDELRALLDNYEPGDQVMVTIQRMDNGYQEHKILVTLGSSSSAAE